MIRPSPCAARTLRPVALLALCLASGCAAGDPLDAAGVAIVPPSGWTAEAAQGLPVPGTRLAGWAGPDGSLVVYRTLPIPGASPLALAREIAQRMENLPGVEIVSSGTAQVGGREASRVELIAMGDGLTLAPSGLGRPSFASGPTPVQTRRISLGLPGPGQTVWIVWHRPEDRPPGGADFDSVVRSIAFKADPPQPR